MYACIGNSEYAPGPYSVTFIAGDVVAEFNISVRDDLIKQSNKNFTLNIDPSSLPHYVSIVEPSSAKVIVMDDDGKCSLHTYNILTPTPNIYAFTHTANTRHVGHFYDNF